MSRRRLVVAGLLLLAVLLPGATASAASWTALASGTASEIRNVEYQSATRFWFVTGSGQIFTRQPDGSFAMKSSNPGFVLNDIEFRGATGIAVGSGGKVLRSTDNGATWNPVSMPPMSNASCNGTQSLGDVNAVRFAGSTQVWLMAEGSQLARSENGGASWVEANRSASNTCKLETSSSAGTGDAFFPAAGVGYFCTAYFGKVFFTSNSLASTAAPKPGDCGNGYSPARRMAGDTVNPNRMWAVTPGGPNISYAKYTQDGWASASYFQIADEDGYLNQTPYDVGSNGGTVVASGDSGMILVSTDGVNFHHQPASGAQATAGWRAVSLASTSDAAVGGQNGALAVSSDANVLPVPATTSAPVTTTSPPAPTAPVLTPVSASQPKTTTTGGTVITIYRLVRVTGHSGRYVPVRVKAKGKRTIRIALYPKGKTKAISTLKVVFKRKGVRLAKVKLPATAKLGKYTVVVKVYKGRNRTGRSVRQAIVVA